MHVDKCKMLSTVIALYITMNSNKRECDLNGKLIAQTIFKLVIFRLKQ